MYKGTGCRAQEQAPFMKSTTEHHKRQNISAGITRRQFLSALGFSGAALVLGGGNCCQNPVAPALHSQPGKIAVNSLTTDTAPMRKPLVAIGQAKTYDAPIIRNQMETMLEKIGGLKDLVKPGVRVGIKVNLTGGSSLDSKKNKWGTESFVTHPEVLRGLGELLKDAGAGKIYCMEGMGDETCWEKFGYTSVAKPLGIELINLCKPAPYRRFESFPVGPEFFVYEQFFFHPFVQELDVFVSVGKVKCHHSVGVTLTMKNLVGLVPVDPYQRKAGDHKRTAFHDVREFDTRLPRVILDLNRARPIHLAVLDGVMTSEGGEGPWEKNFSQVKPGILLASKNPLGADAVATAIMGFDPNAPSGTLPFVRSDNYLALARENGFGTNVLKEIDIVNSSIEEVQCNFKPVL